MAFRKNRHLSKFYDINLAASDMDTPLHAACNYGTIGCLLVGIHSLHVGNRKKWTEGRSKRVSW